MKKKIIKTTFFTALVALDQLTKLWAKTYLADRKPLEIIADFFYLTYTENTGAAWSILSGYRLVFIIIGIGALAMMAYWLKTTKTNWGKYSLIMMMAGTLGNLIDRIYKGRVSDFLDFYPFGYDFPIFNVADSCLCIGVAIMFLDMIFEDKPWIKKL